MKWILFILSITLSKSLSAQEIPTTVDLNGIVLDKRMELSLPFANVSLFQNDTLIQHTQSDYNGRFNLTAIENSGFKITIEFVGYEPIHFHYPPDLRVEEISTKFRMMESEINSWKFISAYKIPMINLLDPWSGQTFEFREMDKVAARH
ncbi:MAG: carboxypeptidase-like regulatory domain-containing protein [Bacteroidota bacterium]